MGMLEGKVVLITGGARGQGRAHAVASARGRLGRLMAAVVGGVRRLRILVLVLAIALTLGPLAAPLAAPASAGPVPSCSSMRWVASWYAAPSDATVSQPPLEQTFRIQVRPTRGGALARFRFSNRFGMAPVTFGSATVGLQARGPALTTGTLRPITFGGGQRRVVVPRGSDVLSDPVRIGFSTFRKLLVSVHVVGAPGPATQHALSEQTTWQSPPLSGDRTHNVDGRGFLALPLRGLIPSLPQAIPYLIGVDVIAPQNVGAVVTFGDSITDGTEAEVLPLGLSADNVDTFASYPDQLATRIQRAQLPFAVANAGISGNQLLIHSPIPILGRSGLSRFNFDALARPGTTTVILLEGINDIGMSFATADRLIAGYKDMIRQAHARGVRILLGTLTPQNGTIMPPNYGGAAEPIRQAVNRWIRAQTLADGIVDFDKAVRDPQRASRILPEYDGGDHLHLSAAGYKAMAAAVPLSKIARPRCS